MDTRTLTFDDRQNRPRERTRARALLRLLWHVVRLPALAVLLVFEPFVSLLLTAVGFLGFVLALMLKFSDDLPRFPFWDMVTISIGALLLLIVYHLIIRIFAL